MSTDEEREAVLRGYLLGALPPAQQEEIDEQFLDNGGFHAELLAAADDLIHAYLAGELTSADRERFESHFLAARRQRERLAFVRSLMSAVDRVRAPGVGAPAPRRSSLIPVLPWAAVLVVGLVAGGWSIGEKRRSERTLAAAQEREDSLRQRLSAQEERVRELEGRVRVGAESADIATWALGSGVERGEAASDRFTVRAAWIRIRVLLDHDLRISSYRACLQTPEGREILRVGGLREASGREGRTLDIVVPAGLLRPGTYLLSIQRDSAGAPVELTAATFVVR